ncbi:acyl-CoA dehydrogenase family protein [Neptuniibacter sp. QD29_5]|uniref:acyl-CoA dehydrogenase family protein n=1 Tax=Neptuniibacter sp. QD29_5 TaxID=3398207 RepID=UPI0039F49FC9
MIPRTIFESEHEIFRDSVRKFIEDQVAPYHEEWEDKGEVDRNLWLKAGEQGLLAPTVPEEFGGVGVDYRYNAVVSEELARSGFTGPGWPLHSDIAVPYIFHNGSKELKARYLPGCVTGEIVTAIAMTEPGTGSDLQGIKTTAVLDGDHYIINGSKTFITWLPVWEIVNSVFQSTVQQMTDTHQDGIPNLTWLIPANPGRCKSDSIIQCLSDLKANSRTTGKKTKTLFNLDVLLPIAGIDDKQGRAAWLYDMKPHKEHCSLYNDGFESYNSIFDGNLEVIVLPNEFAVVAYHFYREGLTPVPIPFGFITSNRQKVAHVSDFVERLCSEQIALNQPRIIGPVADEKKQ